MSSVTTAVTRRCLSAPPVVKCVLRSIFSACVFVVGSATIQDIGVNASTNRIACAKRPNKLENEWAVREISYCRFQTSRRVCIGLPTLLRSVNARRLSEFGQVTYSDAFLNGQADDDRCWSREPDVRSRCGRICGGKYAAFRPRKSPA